MNKCWSDQSREIALWYLKWKKLRRIVIWPRILREERSLRILMKVFGCKRVDVSVYWRDEMQQNGMGGASDILGGGRREIQVGFWGRPVRKEILGKYRRILTPWCRVVLEQLTGLQLVKKFPAFHGTRRFITALTSVRHLSLSRPVQSIYPHPTSWRSILILSTHLRRGLPTGFFPSGFPTKILYTLYIGLPDKGLPRKCLYPSLQTYLYFSLWWHWISEIGLTHHIYF